MKPILLSPMYYGKECKIRTPNGKEYRHVVRYAKDKGLYIVIANKRYLERDMIKDFK